MISIPSWYYLFLFCWQLYENRNPLSSGIPDKIVPAGQGVGKNQWSCVCDRKTESEWYTLQFFICQTVSLTEKYETHVAVRRIEVRMCHCTSKSQKHQQQLTSELSVNSSKTLTNYWCYNSNSISISINIKTYNVMKWKSYEKVFVGLSFVSLRIE